MPNEAISYRAECGTTLREGDRAYDYYSMKPGVIGRPASLSTNDGWFYFRHDDGSELLLNGQRICSLAFAARREFPGALAALAAA